ncbi:hypothetical protein JCM19241_3785 [Vibrio ishigakensis]|uniref:Uncharacterized protein n=1 Tax=Vibrio ishigakensis TaxID=1481914 RepID=A0A0B8QN58_9VIBR|nr:hypothetical protein JCM19241_3785 [Vibrio ishigakensis]
MLTLPVMKASRRKYLGLVSASLPQTLALHHCLPLTYSEVSAMTLSHAKPEFPLILALESD